VRIHRRFDGLDSGRDVCGAEWLQGTEDRDSEDGARRSMIRRALLCCVVLLWAVEARAQTVPDERVWFVLTLQEAGSADSHWRWNLETIIRSREGVSDLD